MRSLSFLSETTLVRWPWDIVSILNLLFLNNASFHHRVPIRVSWVDFLVDWMIDHVHISILHLFLPAVDAFHFAAFGVLGIQEVEVVWIVSIFLDDWEAWRQWWLRVNTLAFLLPVQWAIVSSRLDGGFVTVILSYTFTYFGKTHSIESVGANTFTCRRSGRDRFINIQM